MMRCERCLRGLLRPGVTINTKAGELHFGTHCAARIGLRERRTRRERPAPLFDRRPAPRRDKRTLDWVEELREGRLP